MIQLFQNRSRNDIIDAEVKDWSENHLVNIGIPIDQDKTR